MAVRKAPKPVVYDAMVRGTNNYIPVSFVNLNSADNTTTPKSLEGKIAVLTVKAVQYDGIRPEKIQGTAKADWQNEQKDISSAITDVDKELSGFTYDVLFKISVDCDDATSGEAGPTDTSSWWKNNYHGMYGLDPAEGRVIFRISKRQTQIPPAIYYFDVRIMEKSKSELGLIKECRDFMPVFGTIEIVGTPTNRTSVFDWKL